MIQKRKAEYSNFLVIVEDNEEIEHVSKELKNFEQLLWGVFSGSDTEELGKMIECCKQMPKWILVVSKDVARGVDFNMGLKKVISILAFEMKSEA